IVTNGPTCYCGRRCGCARRLSNSNRFFVKKQFWILFPGSAGRDARGGRGLGRETLEPPRSAISPSLGGGRVAGSPPAPALFFVPPGALSSLLSLHRHAGRVVTNKLKRNHDPVKLLRRVSEAGSRAPSESRNVYTCNSEVPCGVTIGLTERIE